MNVWRLMALCLASLPLAACNSVISEKPWFAEASGPQMKEGLWAQLESPDCRIDPSARIEDWPSCAAPVWVKRNSYAAPESLNTSHYDPSTWPTLEHILVDGKPQIDQVLLDAKSAKAFDSERTQPLFIYIAAEPMRVDGAGRITEVRYWPVLCGPVPERPRVERGQTLFVTERPYPGLNIRKDMCSAQSEADLRAAAASSEPGIPGGGVVKIVSRWIRPGVK